MASEDGDALRVEEQPVSKDVRHTTDEYIAIGAYTDCDTILEKYLTLRSSTFEDFVKLWKEFKFSEIFCGRETFGELLEFTEELMYISKAFILPPYSQIKRIGALYLMYGLYTQQPTQGLVKFRITPQEWAIILKFIEKLKVHGFIDANYIFHKMCMDGAFLTVSHPREYGLERNIRKYLMPWPARDKETQPCSVYSLESLLSRACRSSLKAQVNACMLKYNNLKKLSGSSFQPMGGTNRELDTVLQDNIDTSVESATSLLTDNGLKRGTIKGKALQTKKSSRSNKMSTVDPPSTKATLNSGSDEFESLDSDSGDEYLLQKLKKTKKQVKKGISKPTKRHRNLGKAVQDEVACTSD